MHAATLNNLQRVQGFLPLKLKRSASFPSTSSMQALSSYMRTPVAWPMHGLDMINRNPRHAHGAINGTGGFSWLQAWAIFFCKGCRPGA